MRTRVVGGAELLGRQPLQPWSIIVDDSKGGLFGADTLSQLHEHSSWRAWAAPVS